MFSSGPLGQKQMQDSFMAFCVKEENQDLLDLAQQEEIDEKLTIDEETSAMQLRSTLSLAGSDTLNVFRPFLKHRILANLITSMSNDREEGESAPMALMRWAGTTQMIDVLGAAKRMIERNDMEEDQLERLLVAHLRSQGTIKPTRSVLPSSSLASALNEATIERAKAEKCIEDGLVEKAGSKLKRALAIVESIKGSNENDESLVKSFRVDLLIDLGVQNGMGEPGSAVSLFDRALSEDPSNGRARVEKARALIGRSNFQEASRELDKASKDSPFLEDVIDELKGLIRSLQIAGIKRERDLARRALGL